MRSKQQSWNDDDADEDGESPYSDDGEATADNGVAESKGGHRSSGSSSTAYAKVCCATVFFLSFTLLRVAGASSYLCTSRSMCNAAAVLLHGLDNGKVAFLV
jgi:hypothetical protein